MAQSLGVLALALILFAGGADTDWRVVRPTLWEYGIAKGMVWFANRVWLEYEGLYPVLTLALVLFTYGVTATVGGNGVLAVDIAGLVMGNSDLNCSAALG